MDEVKRNIQLYVSLTSSIYKDECFSLEIFFTCINLLRICASNSSWLSSKYFILKQIARLGIHGLLEYPVDLQRLIRNPFPWNSKEETGDCISEMNNVLLDEAEMLSSRIFN